MKRVLKPGMVMCLGGCDKEFWSKDKPTNRICRLCERRIDRDQARRATSVKIHWDNALPRPG